jgi:hypothetical protein
VVASPSGRGEACIWEREREEEVRGSERHYRVGGRV